MKLLFIQNVCILNNCKDRDQLIICRVYPFLSSVEFLHPMYLDSFKYQLCSFGNIKCVQTYVPGFNMYYLEIGPKYSSFVKQNHMSWPIIFCFLHQTISHPALSSKGQSKASEFWQIIPQVSKCTKIGETIQKTAPPHWCTVS